MRRRFLGGKAIPGGFLLLAVLVLSAPAGRAERVLVDFGKSFDPVSLRTRDARVILEAGRLSVRTGTRERWPGITLDAPGESWNLSFFGELASRITNTGRGPITVHCRVDNPGADGRRHCRSRSLRLSAGETGTLRVRLNPTPWRLSRPLELVGMRAAPGSFRELDASRVTRILFYVAEPREEQSFAIESVLVRGDVETLPVEEFLPFIDEFGQFIHADWPGKTHDAGEFEARRWTENRELAAQPGPADRNAFGGWTGGPRLRATGFFRVEKHRGNWWLVDPEGRLFWSHGVDCVRHTVTTPITDRKQYFRALPPTRSGLARFRGTGTWAPHGYYHDRTPYSTYDFGAANLLRKYGENWKRQSAELAHHRLRSWGLNTIANWSDPETCRLRRTPYVSTIDFRARPLEGSTGYWGKFFDVFDPGFRDSLRRRLREEKGKSAGDPWCIGYFVHNELGWGDETSLAVATLISPPDQPAKKVFVGDLRSRHGSIARLNDAWGSEYRSWDALLASREPPDRRQARQDLVRFYDRTAGTYFRTIRDELRRVAPNQLYLGCRFAWVNDHAARAAIEYCDVVSYNRYAFGVDDLRLPGGADRPAIIGEFHFGALDRGMFHTGLRAAASQEERAGCYRRYVEGALRNPLIVGTHWFQYRDQATTGRGDGENYQIGLVDVCDTPYQETIRACREIGDRLYEYRLGQR